MQLKTQLFLIKYILIMTKKLLLQIVFICCSFAAFAQQSREELQKQQQQILKELQELNNNLSAIRSNKKAALGAYALVQDKIRKREQLINTINKDIRFLDEELYTNEVEVYRLRKELDTLKQQYAKSLVFAYKNRGSYDYLNFLFSAKNFNDAVKRYRYLKSYRQFRETQAETITKTQSLLQTRIGTLAANKNEKNNVLQNQSTQLKVLEVDKQEKDQVVKQLKDQEKDIAVQIKKREKERMRLNKAIDVAIKRAFEEEERKAKLARLKAAEDEKRRIANQKAQQIQKDKDDRDAIVKNNKTTTKPSVSEPTEGVVTSTNNKRTYTPFESTTEGLTQSLNFEKNKGRLPWPLDGGTIIGRFGKEKYGDTKLVSDNDGIFIKTNVGASVKCVADGVVLTVIDLDQYQAVMVQHGKYFSLYVKLSNVSVSKDDVVKSGTVLGKVASDFDGEGQFEFQIMNERKQFQNPEFWLRRK
jgi:murein hydrolase activator